MFNNNSNNKIGITDSPTHHKSIITASPDTSSNLTNKLSNSFIRTATLPRRFKEKFLNKAVNSQQENVISPSNNSLSLSSNSSTCSTSIVNNSELAKESLITVADTNQELISNLNKLISKYFKTIKYLEQIINKKKYEIIASSSTATLESVLDIYNLIQTFNLSNDKQFKHCRDKINKSLANLIKWSDSILLSTESSHAIDLRIDESSKKLIKHLNKSIRNLIKYLKMSESDLVKSMSSFSYSSSSPSLSTLSSLSSTSSTSSISISISPQDKASSLSSASSNQTNMKTPGAFSLTNDKTSEDNWEIPKTDSTLSPLTTTITTIIDEKNGTTTTQTTIEKKSSPSLNCSSFSLSSASSNGALSNVNNTYVTQTSTLTTTTTTNSSHMSSELLLANTASKASELTAFFDLDRLVLELSELSNDKTFESSNATPISEKSPSINNTSFTNEQCDYLVSQFETFAKKFNKQSFDLTSNGSTLDQSNFGGSATLSSDTLNLTKRKTLHTSKVFKHDLDQKLCVIEGIIKDLKDDDDLLKQIKSAENSLSEFQKIETDLAENGRILNRITDHKTISKKDFIETNIVVDDKPVDDILKTTDDPVRSFMSLFDSKKNKPPKSVPIKRERRRSVTCSSSSSSESSSPDRSNHSNRSSISSKDTKPVDSVDEEEDDDGNMNPVIFGANNLNPQFLLIDDEEDDDDDEEIATLAIDDDKNNTNIDSLCKKLQDVNYIADDDDINDYKDTLIDQDLKLKKLIDDSISIKSYNLLSFKRDKENQSNETNKKLMRSTWSLASTSSNKAAKAEPKIDDNAIRLTTLPSSTTIQIQNNTEQNVLDLLDVNHLLEYQATPNTNTIILSNRVLFKSPSSVSTTTLNSAPTNILRGGHIDALIVLATSANTNVVSAVSSSKSKLNPKTVSHQSLVSAATISNENKGNFLFQEAFLTTYRTIIEPIDLINKLIYRYRLFSKYTSNKMIKNGLVQNLASSMSQTDDKFDLNRLKTNIKNNKLAASAARNSLALLVRVLDDLGNELNEKTVETFADFVYELLIDNELQLARLLRKKLLFKLDTNRNEKQVKASVSTNGLKKMSSDLVDSPTIPYSINTFTKNTNQSLLDFKSVDLAEQITLIDLNLFLKIELSEVLLWSTKQSEKHSPNLIKFTEHFNKISYWARSRILEHDSMKEREKIVIKFLKIMKHLRKFNNFNSYLSILSAVDSGPIQRLDWPKSLTDSVKEFAALIDPKCGFKCLREAVSEAQPPCIPHIGLILQDLTILHIANSDYLPSGNCNFWKRWQQFNILERLRCFRRCNYDFKPDAKILKFFNSFEDYFGEDAQYNISEQLKPRSRHH